MKLGKTQQASSQSFLEESEHSELREQVACFSDELRLQMEICMSFTEVGFWSFKVPSSGTLDAQIRVFCSDTCMEFLSAEADGKQEQTLGFWCSRVHSDDFPRLQEEALQYVQGDAGQSEFTFEFRLLQEPYGWRWMHLVGKLFLNREGILHFGGLLRDITNIRKIQRDLENQMAFQQGLIEILQNPVFVKDAEGRYVTFNKAYEEAFGMSRENFIGKTVLDLPYLPFKDRLVYQQEDKTMIQSGKNLHREVDFIFADGCLHHCLYWSSGFYNTEKRIGGLIGMIVDITERRTMENELAQKIEALNSANAEIEKISRIDCLTGLANRRAFMGRLNRILSMARRHKETFSLVMADLDYFKKINDTYGHNAGDEVLRKFSSVLRNVCRREDTVARVGGEEFLLLLPKTQLVGARMVAERILRSVRESTERPFFTVSLGVVEYVSGEEMNQILRRVDQALYQAKNTGRDKICSLPAEVAL